MAFTVERTDSFEHDLDGVIAYLVDDLKAPNAALNLLNAVEDAIALLGEMPYLHSLSTKKGLETGFCREHLVKNHVIVYRAEDNRVIFLRLFHQQQFYENRLGLSE